MRLAVLLVVAACGRIGFGEHGGGGGGAFDGGAFDGARAPDSYDGPGTIALVVESEGSNAGMPVAGADVLVENGSGFDRTTTAADGTASFAVAGPTTFHVAYLVSGGLWRVYTIGAARAGSTVTLGGRPAGTATSASMTLSLPAGSGGTYTYSLGMCSNAPNYGGATFAVSYLSSCEGRTVHLFAYDLATSEGYIDAGPLVLKANTTRTVSGSYQAMPSHAVHVANLPANTQSVYPSIELAQGGDLVILDPDPVSATPSGTTLDTTVLAPPAGNLLELQLDGIQSNPISATGFEYLATDTTGNVSVDAAGALPVFTAMTTSPASAGIAWSPLVSAGVIYAVDATASNVHWTAYVDAGTDHVAFPALPADLAAASPASWNDAQVSLYDVPGKNAATLVTTIDHDPTQLDLATSSNISYVPF